MEKIHERMASNMDSAKFSQAMPGGETRREGHQNKRGREWKMRAADSSDDERNRGSFRGRTSSQVLHGESEIRGKNHGDNYETFQNMPVQVKEGGYVGGTKNRFEQWSNVLNGDVNSAKEGKNLVGIKEDAQAAGSSFLNNHVPSTNLVPAGNFGEQVGNSPQGLGFVFSSLGGKFSGPVIADIEKSIRGAQGGGSATKRKVRDGNYDRVGLQSSRRRKKIPGDGDLESGTAPGGEMGNDLESEFLANIGGSGMAEAGFQPRRPH